MEARAHKAVKQRGGATAALGDAVFAGVPPPPTVRRDKLRDRIAAIASHSHSPHWQCHWAGALGAWWFLSSGRGSIPHRAVGTVNPPPESRIAPPEL
jgi:hypothetical protein